MKILSVLFFILCSLFCAPTLAQTTSESQDIHVDLSHIKDPQELERRIQELVSATGESILNYDINVTVNKDSTLDVEETIRVHATGLQIRRGIYRGFPTRYKDRYGNNVVVGFSVQSLLRDGKPEPWFTETKSNGVRMNFGNDDFLPVPANYTYTLRYTTNRQIGFFKDHDELYWNAIGTGWDFAIQQGQVTVRLPHAVPINEMRAEGYTGTQGAIAQNFTARLPTPGEAQWTLTQSLQPRQGLTIVLSFPKGILTEPTTEQKLHWFLNDNRGVGIGLGGLLLIFIYLYSRWRKVGVDPDPGIIITRYDPPEGFSPAALRFIQKRNISAACFTADILELAVKGLVTIKSEKKVLGNYSWTLERTSSEADSDLPTSQRALLEELFENSPTLAVTPENRARFMSAKLTQFKVLEKAYNGRMFKNNSAAAGWALLFCIGVMVAAFYLSGGAGIAALVVICIVMLVMIITFTFLLAAPTLEGRKILDYIEGFKRYLSVAERDELAKLQGPGTPPMLDAQRYEALLPYAVALDVEGAWTEKFTLAVGEAQAQQTANTMTWYRGSAMSSLTQFSSSLSSSFNSSIASASTPPGSSSGGGGGGSSGGGGGGGGGGGR